jgi:hypothetical protein
MLELIWPDSRGSSERGVLCVHFGAVPQDPHIQVSQRGDASLSRIASG